MSENATYEQMLAQINPASGWSTCLPVLPSYLQTWNPVALIREPEGITIGVTLEEAARAGLSTADPYTIITLSAPRFPGRGRIKFWDCPSVVLPFHPGKHFFRNLSHPYFCAFQTGE
ncbi:hypothetical protein [Mobiluncus curtisii]|uniref:Uncharacterized protein n=1 Tax=Mobiluncus curtisii TaxID=2051 RepID=A0A2X3BLJ5_9ACTO|nr:hypothetical protein [Mobiluncus curtisii]SQC01513.1 Uncharacterised protein [Mobiluncus curtisii]